MNQLTIFINELFPELAENRLRSQPVAFLKFYAMDDEDVAVLIVPSPLWTKNKSAAVRPLMLSLSDNGPVPQPGETASLAGWGSTCYKVGQQSIGCHENVFLLRPVLASTNNTATFDIRKDLNPHFQIFIRSQISFSFNLEVIEIGF